MNVIDLIEQANHAGIALSLTDTGTVKVSGNEDAVAALISAIREHKPEIVAMLRRRQERSMHLARLAIAKAALTGRQKASRLRDLEREPTIAPFWAQMYRDDQKAEKADE